MFRSLTRPSVIFLSSRATFLVPDSDAYSLHVSNNMQHTVPCVIGVDEIEGVCHVLSNLSLHVMPNLSNIQT